MISSVLRSIVIVGGLPALVWASTPATGAHATSNKQEALRGAYRAPSLDLPALALGAYIGGRTASVAVQAGRVYLAEGARVSVFDVSQEGEPRRIGQSAILPGVVLDVATYDRTATAVVERLGLYFLDISNPAEPRLAGELRLTGTLGDVELSGGYAYMASGGTGLRVVDARDPARAGQATVFKLAGGHRASVDDVSVVGDRAYVVGLENGDAVLRVLDVADPAQPTMVGGMGLRVPASRLAVSGSHAFVVVPEEGLYVVDISASNPRHVRTVPAAGSRYVDVRVVGSTAYVSTAQAGAFGLAIVDATDPQAPVEVASISTPARPSDLDAEDGAVYLSGADGALRVVDASEPRAPRLAATVNVPAQPSDVAFASGHAYVADEDGLWLFAPADGPQPRGVGLYNPGWTPRAIASRGSLLYVTAGPSGLFVLDTATPRAPQVLGQLAPPSSSVSYGPIALAGDLAYVLSAAGQSMAPFASLHIIDISDPTQPRLTNQFATSLRTDPNQMVVRGDYVMLAAGGAGLGIIDVVNPAEPFEIGYLGLRGSVRSVSVLGDNAYASAGPVLRVVSLVDERRPEPVGELALSGESYGLEALAQQAYVFVRHEPVPEAGLRGGLFHLGLGQPLAPEELRSLALPAPGTETAPPGFVERVALSPSNAYVAAGPAGLMVVPVEFSLAYLPRVVRGQ
jgi:hypothetical protein